MNLMKAEYAVLYNTSSGQISLAFGQDPCTWMIMSLNICACLSTIYGILASICHYLLPSNHLLPSDCFFLSQPLASHIIGSFSTYVYWGLSPALQSLSLQRQGVE